MKEINSYLPCFPLDVLIGAPCVTPATFQDNELKDILDTNLPQTFKHLQTKSIQCVQTSNQVTILWTIYKMWKAPTLPLRSAFAAAQVEEV